MIKSKKDILKKVIFRDCSACAYHGTMGCPNSNLCYSTEHKPYFIPNQLAMKKIFGKLDWEVFGGKTLEVRLLWMQNSRDDFDSIAHGRWNGRQCSNCAVFVPYTMVSDPLVNFCPHCGAKMDAEE